MNGRFASAVVAFALATAFVAKPHLIPEFALQLHDPNLAGGPIFAWLLHTFGYAFVTGLCAVLCGGTIMLTAWRARMRGASDWHCALTAALVVLCLLGRLGVSLDPIGWICAAAFCLLLDRPSAASARVAVAIAAFWSVVQGGASIAAVIAILAAAGAWIDARAFDGGVRRMVALAAGATIVGALQLHDLPWHAYGAHALYLDGLLAGAQRDHLWSSGISPSTLGFAGILTVAAWYGLRRRGRAGDALIFFALLLLALADARNLPYFGIFAAPIVADALASYYVSARDLPVGSVHAYSLSFAAAAVAFIAVLTVSEPRVAAWPAPEGAPTKLLAALSADHTSHFLLCAKPRWCDGVGAAYGRVRTVIDDRAGLARTADRRLEYDVTHVRPGWQRELRGSGVDAVIATRSDDLSALLAARGWRVSAAQGSRVLLQRGRLQ